MINKTRDLSFDNNIITVRNLFAWYGDAQVLHGIDIDVPKSQLVGLAGRNGAGRSTTLKAILGIIPKITGDIRIKGKNNIGKHPHEIARFAKIGYCPEERGIFSKLTVDENLRLPPVLGKPIFDFDEIYNMFPNLWKRKNSYGNQLSGGEQQMLALARILRTGADILILDEITEGLAPIIVKQLRDAILTMKERGMTILLVEQNFFLIAPLLDWLYVIEEGKTVMTVEGTNIEKNLPDIQKRLGI